MDTGAFAMSGLIQIVLSLVFIGLSWWALQVVRWDVFFIKPNSPQAKLLVILLSVMIGSAITAFFNNYFAWSTMLKYLF